jgi:hypothetical protein
VEREKSAAVFGRERALLLWIVGGREIGRRRGRRDEETDQGEGRKMKGSGFDEEKGTAHSVAWRWEAIRPTAATTATTKQKTVERGVQLEEGQSKRDEPISSSFSRLTTTHPNSSRSCDARLEIAATKVG